TLCGNCKQQYIVFFQQSERSTYKGDMLLYQKPQAIFLEPEEEKLMRDTFCLECHHAYYSISDRISMIVDSVMDIAHITDRLGPMEVRCKFRNCKQRWEIMV